MRLRFRILAIGFSCFAQIFCKSQYNSHSPANPTDDSLRTPAENEVSCRSAAVLRFVATIVLRSNRVLYEPNCVRSQVRTVPHTVPNSFISSEKNATLANCKHFNCACSVKSNCSQLRTTTQTSSSRFKFVQSLYYRHIRHTHTRTDKRALFVVDSQVWCAQIRKFVK